MEWPRSFGFVRSFFYMEFDLHAQQGRLSTLFGERNMTGYPWPRDHALDNVNIAGESSTFQLQRRCLDFTALCHFYGN